MLTALAYFFVISMRIILNSLPLLGSRPNISIVFALSFATGSYPCGGAPFEPIQIYARVTSATN